MSWLLSLALTAVATAAVIGVGRRTNAPTRTALLALPVAAVVWLLGLAIVASGWNDVDGFIDCGVHCNGWHRLGSVLVVTPVLAAIAFTVVAIVSAVVGRGRRRTDA